MSLTKADVVKAARKYVGAPFRHQGRSIKTGIDCIGLIVCVARDLGIPVQDRTDYGVEPAKSALPKALREQLKVKCSTLTKVEDCGCKGSGKEYVGRERYKPGCIVLFKFKYEPQHVGIITDIGVVHSYQSRGRCVEHRLDDKWARRIVEVYSFPGVN